MNVFAERCNCCLFVTRVCCNKTAEAGITLFSLKNGPLRWSHVFAFVLRVKFKDEIGTKFSD